MEPITEDGSMFLLELYRAWKMFKAGHDYRELRIQCCNHSKALFDSLEKMEKLLEGLKEGGETHGPKPTTDKETKG